MSKPSTIGIYRLCLKSGTFKDQKPSFVIKMGLKYQKKINMYFINSDKQRYNYDLFLQKSPDTDIMIHCQLAQELLGTAILKVDSRKSQQPNQTLSVMNSKKQKIATIDCSLKKIQKKNKKPSLKIQIIQATYNLSPQQQQPSFNKQSTFIVLKYGDSNYQTKPVSLLDNAPVWKQTFICPQSQSQRIFVQTWKQLQDNSYRFMGLALIQITKAINTEKDYDINFDKKKIGVVKIAINQNNKLNQQEDVKINDKNYMRKRTIKAYVIQTLLKNPSKTGTFIRILSSKSNLKYQTIHSFQTTKQLAFNQSFTLQLYQNQQLTALLLINDQMQQQMGRVVIKVKDIQNKKYQFKLKDGEDKQIGTLYMEFYDQDIDIKEEIINNQSAVAVSQPSKQKQQSKASKVNEKTVNKLNETNEQLKKRYANRQSIHDYMNQVNTILQQGLLKIAKQRPQNPIKQLGLFLINYKQN